jgi:purine-binding chemotaxis protein CheW
MRIQTKDIEQAPQTVLESHNYIRGIAKNNEKLTVLLDAVKFLEGSSSDISKVMEGNKQ